jgi:hypothetical protein
VRPGALPALRRLANEPDDERVLDELLYGWRDDYYEGRVLLLARVRSLNARIGRRARQRLATRVFESLVTLGEDLGDMRFVHLAVECRDALIYDAGGRP